MKEIVAKAIAARVKDGEILGVGTGTTVDAALLEIGKRVASEGIRVSVVPTSYQSAWRCQELGLTVLTPGYAGYLSWGFDGADQIDRNRWAIKGKGGALLQEKILALRCKSFVVIVDDSKVVDTLGHGCAVPIEVIPEAYVLAKDALQRFGITEIITRSGSGKHGPVITERGNILLDVMIPQISADTEISLKTLPGVVDSGLFTQCISEVLVASAEKGVYSF